MNLPARAFRYVRRLRAHGQVRGTVRSTLEEIREFGVSGPIRYALEFLGVENYMRVRCPGMSSPLRVTPSPYWKYWKALEAGSHDLENLEFLSSFLKPGQTVLDIGAWEGPYTLLFADRVGKDGKVYAFEPDPKAFAVLRRNVRVNGCANVHAEAWCLSNVEGTAPFYDSGGGTIGSLIGNDLVAGLPQSEVRTTTVDRFSLEHGISVDGMKVDVEGAEGLVLDGARGVIGRYSPWVFLEFHGVLMAAAERERCWARIVQGAREITFVHGQSRTLRAGDKIESYPDCDYFHVLIQY